MKESILAEIKAIEAKENVRIIMAVESGSRAWGFASPDSDYDVRFVYIRQIEDYLKLEGQRDVIEWKLDDVLDINGWDLQKSLRLLYKSNPTFFEWCKSPIVYYQRPEFQKLEELLLHYFSPKKSAYHYLSMAKTNYRGYLQEDLVKVKTYFYVLRPVLAVRWILEKQSPPPVAFDNLMEACLPKDLFPIVEKLLDLKKDLPESGLYPKILELNDFIEQELTDLELAVQSLPNQYFDWEKLNACFRGFLADGSLLGETVG